MFEILCRLMLILRRELQIFLAALIYYGNRWARKNKKLEIASQAVEITSGEGEGFLSSLEEYIKKSDLKVEEIIKKQEKKFEEAYYEDLQLAKKLSVFSEKNKLDRALIAIWEEIMHYPSWSKLENFNQIKNLNISDVVSESKDNHKNGKISFLYDDTRYAISLEKAKLYVGDVYATFCLLENNEDVFIISAMEDSINEFFYYGSTSVKCFKQKGDWAKFLIKAFNEIQISKAKKNIELKKTDADKIKNNFSDGEHTAE